jgi:general secretion pathway protein L
MIGAFIAWWVGQLSELLPVKMLGPDPAGADALLISPIGPVEHATAVRLVLRRNGKELPLGELPLGADELGDGPRAQGRPILLRLPKAAFLEKHLVLPLAAQSNLDQALAFEMDRETPFAPEEVYWTRMVEATDRRRDQLRVRLVLLPKLHLESLLDALGASGIAPRWAEVDGAGSDRVMVPLAGDGSRLRDRSQQLLWPAAACCALLALAAIATPFVRQSIQLAALDREVRSARVTANEAEGLRREIDRLARSADLAHREMDKAGRPLEIVAALTQIIPDDTYLTDLELRERKLSLTGRSARAANLIGALAADGRFRNPAFAAPVTRLAALHAEVFSIVAEVVPRR